MLNKCWRALDRRGIGDRNGVRKPRKRETCRFQGGETTGDVVRDISPPSRKPFGLQTSLFGGLAACKSLRGFGRAAGI